MVVFLPQQPIAPTVSNHFSAEMMTSGSALEPGLRSQPDSPAEHLTTLSCKPPAGTRAGEKGGGRPSTGAEAERAVSHLHCDPVPSQRSESSGNEGLPTPPLPGEGLSMVGHCSCLPKAQPGPRGHCFLGVRLLWMATALPVANGKTKKAAQGLSFVEEMRWFREKRSACEMQKRNTALQLWYPPHTPRPESRARKSRKLQRLLAPEPDIQDVAGFVNSQRLTFSPPFPSSFSGIRSI